jgi:16S rRNA (cytosine967-C5)-methyltransferase
VKARSAAITILNRLNNNFFGYEETTEKFLAKNKFSNEDKNFINALVKGVIEYSKYLDFVIEKSYRGNFRNLEKSALNILRLGAFQAKILKTPPHAFVNETVNITKELKMKRLTGLVNGVLRHLQDDTYLDKQLARLPKIKQLAIKYSFPEWVVHKWVKDFGEEETIKLLAYNNQPPVIYFRLNNLRTNKEIFFKLLDNQQIKYNIEIENPAVFFTVSAPGKLINSDLFKRGFCSVQDLSQSFAVNLLQPQGNEEILDLCAAPGGKSTYIAQLTKNTAQLISYDISFKKLKLLQKEIHRLGITCISTVEANSTVVELPQADKILVDAPCTATGILNRKADLRWSRQPKDYIKTNTLQKNMLKNAARALKNGGTLVYSTCSIEKEENVQIINDFLANNPEFTLEPAQNFMDNDFCDDHGFVTILPHKHHMSGAFAARLKKRLD